MVISIVLFTPEFTFGTFHDDDDDEDDSKRPASKQTIRAFREAIAYFNKLRKEDAEKQNKQYEGKKCDV